METIMEYVMGAVLTGTGATMVMDIWIEARKRLFGIPSPGWGLVGRWFAHLARGRFRHDAIAATPAVGGERLIGWAAHYVVGIAFAGVLLAVWGLEWARHPTLAPAIIVGITSVAAPFLVMQPGMGAGIAARRTARPGAARLQSLITHAIFGLGLYAAARAVSPWYAT
jgi:hypothetical protein